MKKINLNIKIIKEIKSQMYPDINVKIKLFLQSIKPEYLETLLEGKKEVQTSTQEIKGYKQQVWDFDTLKEEPTNQKLDETMFDMKKFEKIMDTFKNSKIQEVEKRGKKEKVIKRDYKSIKEFEQLSGYELDYSLNEDNKFIENSILFKEDIIEDNYKDTMKGSINKHFNINKFKDIFIDDTKVKTINSKRDKFKQILGVFAYEHNVSLGNLDSNYNEEVLDLLLLNFPQNSKEEKLYNNLYNDKNKIKMIKDFNDRKTRLIKRFENLTSENRRKYVSDKDSVAFILVSVTEEGSKLLKEIEEGFGVITKTKQRIKDLIKIKKPNIKSSLQEDTMIEYFKYVTFDELHSMQQGVLNNVEPKILSKFFIGYLKEIRKREEEGVEFNFREFKMFFERLEELVEIERQNGNEPTEENYKFDYKLSKEILEANLIETNHPELRPILMNVLNSVSASGVEEFEGISKRKMEKYDEYRYTQKEEKFKDPNMPLTKRLKEVINPKTKQKDFYIVEMMHSKDPRVLFTGEATDCCRIAHGVGESHIDFEIENNDITGTLLFSKLKPNISQKEIERLKDNLDKYNELLEIEGNTEEVVFGKEATNIYETLISSGLIVGMGSSWRNGNQLTLNNVETKKRDQEQLTGYHLEEENGEIFRVKIDEKEHLGSGRLKSEGESINVTDPNGNRIIVRYEREGNKYKEKKTMRINDIENEIIDLNKSYIEDINLYVERMVRNSENIQFVLKTKNPDQLTGEDIEKYEKGIYEIEHLPLYVTMGDAYGSNVVKKAYKEVDILDTDKQYIPVKKVRNGKSVYTDTRSQLLIGGYKNDKIDFNELETIREVTEYIDLDYIIEGLKPLINKEQEINKEKENFQDLK